MWQKRAQGPDPNPFLGLWMVALLVARFRDGLICGLAPFLPALRPGLACSSSFSTSLGLAPSSVHPWPMMRWFPGTLPMACRKLFSKSLSMARLIFPAASWKASPSMRTNTSPNCSSCVGPGNAKAPHANDIATTNSKRFFMVSPCHLHGRFDLRQNLFVLKTIGPQPKQSNYPFFRFHFFAIQCLHSMRTPAPSIQNRSFSLYRGLGFGFGSVGRWFCILTSWIASQMPSQSRPMATNGSSFGEVAVMMPPFPSHG